MPEPIDMIVPLLRELRQDVTQGFSTVGQRLDKVEATLNGYRQALTADSLLSKLVTGEFEERINLLERKVRELERLK
jgi:hypothetical protein